MLLGLHVSLRSLWLRTIWQFPANGPFTQNSAHPLPANDRSKLIFGKLKDKLDAKRKREIEAIRIEIGEFDSPALRTEFFTNLISDLNGFSLKNVTSVKVERLKLEPEEGELDLEDDQETEEAKQEALALVKKVALKGETLLASEEYQSLAKKGFFITSRLPAAALQNMSGRCRHWSPPPHAPLRFSPQSLPLS
ncbi:hypothetical protein ACFSQE_16855 [Vogesella fluminis]|uniref:hypothetical protein n=1 Tax=Vogesella fluminis TaxID=1069161 RepID=UPI00362F4207